MRCLALLVLGFVPACAATPVERPNVVLILADDLGIGDLHCYNRDSKIPTSEEKRKYSTSPAGTV